MNKKTQYIFQSQNAEATEQFAESIGRELKGGEVIQLVGDVGAGKTTFVRGLGRGIGSSDLVTSPTFTVSNVYQSSELSLHHYDFYRIDDVAIMRQELSEVIADPNSIVVLEWAGGVSGVLPDNHVTMNMQVFGENYRSITCDLPQQYNYIRLSS